MTKLLGLMAFMWMLAVPSWSELPRMPSCLPPPEYAPSVVPNPEGSVTFRCQNATPFDLIRAVGRQTRVPIGVAIGIHPTALLTTPHSYDLDRVQAKEALSLAIEGTGYSLKKEGTVFVLMAGDLAPRQKQLLTQRYDGFHVEDQSMNSVAAMLTMWMRAAIYPIAGFGGSILGSTNDEKIRVDSKHASNTEEIANQIVSQGSGGLWIFKADASAPSGPPNDEIQIEPYQHYTNEPMNPPVITESDPNARKLSVFGNTG